jgi:hypothetical protein
MYDLASVVAFGVGISAGFFGSPIVAAGAFVCA